MDNKTNRNPNLCLNQIRSMNIGGVNTTTSFLIEEDFPVTFGEWLQQRRKKLDLTQAALAKRANCTVFALRKIEAGQRRPSKQLAGILANQLEIPRDDQATFIRVARGELHLKRLFPPAQILSRDSLPGDKIGPFPGNLPRELTPFIGREPELTALCQMLGDPQCSLLTIVGPGGIGKTRLAIEVATRQRDIFRDGVWFVSLAPISSSEYLIPAIADALKLQFKDLAIPQEQLLSYLHDKQALLVLDNTEHLLDGSGLFTEILRDCPQVKLLVTSRERLNLLSEWVFEIEGLPMPLSDKIELFEEYSSVRLFLQSALRRDVSFKLSKDEYGCVLRICQLLEGLPLGIELAAAWVGLLSCNEIAEEIERNIDFLSVSSRDLPVRHRSLRATLDHSWNMLDPEEKLILRRLSVFRGSFRREAAEAICGATLAVLSSLKDKSLLRRTDQSCYDLHELIHTYAARRLAEDASEEERVKDQHALYYAQRLSGWEQVLKSSRQVETITEMEREINNLRQAWQRIVTWSELGYMENSQFNSKLFHSSLFSLSLFHEMRCRNWEAISLFRESVECLEAVRQAFDKAEENWSHETALGHVTAYLGLHHYYVLQFKQARELFEKALYLLENDDAEVLKAQAQVMLATIYETQGELQKAVDLFQKSTVIFRKANNDWWYTLALGGLAYSLVAIGCTQEGIILYLEALRRVGEGDLRLGVPDRNGLAYAYYLQGDYLKSERVLEENLGLSLELGNKRLTARCYLLIGQIALATGQLERAEEHIYKCIDLSKDLGESPSLAVGMVYLGKFLILKKDPYQARRVFQNVLRIGQALNIFYLIYWGLVNLARVELMEGQLEDALEIALTLQLYSVELKVVQDDGTGLMAELSGKLLPEQIASAIVKANHMDIESLLERI